MDDAALYDSHFHLQLAGCSQNGVRPNGCTCATSPEDWEETLSAADERITPYIGVHPWFLTGMTGEKLSALKELITAHPGAGVGEIGLDKIKTGTPLDEQRYWFGKQLEIASEAERPVSIHCVRAWGALLDELKKFRDRLPPFFIHAFGGSEEIMHEIIRLGGLISFSPFTIASSVKKGRERMARCPDEYLLLDTDFPYSQGQPLDEYPRIIEELYSLSADIRNMPARRLAQLVRKNMAPFLLPNPSSEGTV